MELVHLLDRELRQVLRREQQVAEGEGVRRATLDATTHHLHGLGRKTEVEKRVAVVRVRRCPIGLHQAGLPEMHGGFLDAPHVLQRQAQVVVRLGDRLAADALPKVDDGFRVAPQVELRRTEHVADARVQRGQRGSRAEAGIRRRKVAGSFELDSGVAQALHLGLRVVGGRRTAAALELAPALAGAGIVAFRDLDGHGGERTKRAIG